MGACKAVIHGRTLVCPTHNDYSCTLHVIWSQAQISIIIILLPEMESFTPQSYKHDLHVQVIYINNIEIIKE